MSSGAARRIYTGLLAPGAIDTVLITDACDVVSVTNVSGSIPMWFTVSHPGGSNPKPVIGGEETYYSASVAGYTTDIRHPGMFGTIVNLTSASISASASVQYQVSIQNKQ